MLELVTPFPCKQHPLRGSKDDNDDVEEELLEVCSTKHEPPLVLLQLLQPFLVAHFKQTPHRLFLVVHIYETLHLEVHHLFVNICNASPLSLFSLMLCTPLLSFLE